jgi:tRNA pseudouridine38-40 synthase
VVHGAGRTDAGVHALGQVASVTLASAHDTSTVLRAVNARLPPDIRVITIEDVADTFHARFNATSKTYRYVIANVCVPSPFVSRFAWHIAEALDRSAMLHAAAVLIGTHDFSAFQSSGSTAAATERTILESALRDEAVPLAGPRAHSVLIYEVTGRGFLRHMVRTIVGTLVEIGRGRRDVSSMHSLITGRPRAEAGPTAPACGLFLVRVDYETNPNTRAKAETRGPQGDL